MKKISTLLIIFLSITIFSFAQKIIKGKVVDRNNQPLEGASIKEKGSNNGTITDKDGNYSITINNSDGVIEFSSTGMSTQQIDAKGKNTIDITLSASTINMAAVEVVGSRSLRRSATETAVPIDIIPIAKMTNTLGQSDLNQILQYVAPSFNSNKQSGGDGVDHVDPASLRGLGPDQTLVLVNGKRWHQSSLVNIFGSRGRGNTGTDLNTIPAASIERIEILRDGAAAQYGSDAIAGVINIILKSNTNVLTGNISTGGFITGWGKSLNSDKGKIIDKKNDGLTTNANINYGFKLKNDGFINITGDYLTKKKTFRPNFETLYPDNYRKKMGDASSDNYSLYLNGGVPIKGKTSFYFFGGANRREGSAFAYTRTPESERNVISVYPNGFDPLIESKITDVAISLGIRSQIKGWNTDFNATLGSNQFKYYVDKTINASLKEASPRSFYSGGFQLAQNTIGLHINKAFDNVAKGANLAFGTEIRQDQYKLCAGELASYKDFGPVVFSTSPDLQDTVFRPGGAQGFPGFQPKDENKKTRINWGAYGDGEIDITKSFMVSGAVRIENYSDFGWTTNFKLASRLKILDNLSMRGSISTGFRAPSLPQVRFSSTFTNVVAGAIYETVIASNDGILAKTVGIPQLKEEKSVNASFGFTATPIKNLSITIDGYSVTIKDRVVLTGLFDQSDDAIGQILTDLNVGSAQFFTNAVNTKTTGLDIITSYAHKIGSGRLGLTFAGNFNKLKLDKITTIPALVGKEDIYYGRREQYFLRASAPPHKLSFNADYTIKKFSANLRFSNFAKVEIVNFADEVQNFKSKTTTDLSFGYMASKNIRITLGGANIFDVYPDYHDSANTETGGMWEAVQMGFGGAFFFGKIGFKF
ncbi:MAG: TonB-dependent receptor [Chitinophagaceae bacterium]|nr:TonB-dependent receptor [Chitinophagaceae bacterium]